MRPCLTWVGQQVSAWKSKLPGTIVSLLCITMTRKQQNCFSISKVEVSSVFELRKNSDLSSVKRKAKKFSTMPVCRNFVTHA